MGILLTIIAFILIALIAPFGMLFGTIKSIIEGKANEYYKEIAIVIDQFGNVSCSYLLNFTLIKKNGYRFGNRKETISSCIGKNKQGNTLSLVGKVLYKTLDTIQKNHCEDSIDKNVTE